MVDPSVIVIGGGFFGCSLALGARAAGHSVLVLERGDDLLTRASYANQARVHQGYHYPRNIITGLRSAANFEPFVQAYQSAIVSDFVKIYAVARHDSKITAHQFSRFCEQIKAPIRVAPPKFKNLFTEDLIEEVFEVREYAFNAARLRETLREELIKAGVQVELGVVVDRVAALPGGGVAVHAQDGREWATSSCFNCTYSQVNWLLANSGLPPIGLKHELAEIALVRPQGPLDGLGITVVDGPFFSTMPFPADGLYSFTHVRYTPQHRLQAGKEEADPHAFLAGRSNRSNFPLMLRDATRYLPACRELEYKRSIYEIKTVLTANEQNDGRPILFRSDYGIPGFHVVLGGKIDNVFDILQTLDRQGTLQK